MDENQSIFSLAIEHGDHAEVARLLEKGVDVNYIDSVGFGPLHRAVRKGYLDIVELLIKRNANVNANTNANQQPIRAPLSIAAMFGHLDVLKLLIEHGASLNNKCLKGLLPIHLAAQEDHLHIVKYFVENKLYHVDVLTNNLQTSLICATSVGRTDIVEFLIQYNADVNKTDMFDRTALHYACSQNHEDILEMLVKKGANLDVKSYSGETPLHLCIERGNLRAIKFLIANGAKSHLQGGVNGNSPLHLAAQYNRKDVLAYFLQMGFNANFRTIDGYSLLHVAARFGHSRIVRFLIQKGANVEGKILSRGTTVLHLASSFNRWQVMNILINKGADVMVTDRKGRRPLDVVYEHFNADLTEARRIDMKYSAELLVQHMLLFHKDIEVSTPSNYPSGKTIENFKQMCLEEIEQMKYCFIENTTVSLHTFLQDLHNEKKLLKFLRNNELREEVKNIKKYIDMFRIYSSILPMVLEIVHRGIRRLKLLEKAYTAMDIIVPNLLYECKMDILKLLDNKDLSSLIESVGVEFY